MLADIASKGGNFLLNIGPTAEGVFPPESIERLRAILSSDALLMQVVVKELEEVRERFGDERRTAIIDESGEIRIEDLIADEDMAITVTNTGYIKRTPISTYRMQRRGGKGRIGMRTREEDFVTHLFVASTHAYILIFSDRGRVYWLKVYSIPDVGPDGKGKAIANLVAMLPDEERSKGVWTISAGNAGQGVAYAARRAGVPCTVVAIETAPAAKMARMPRSVRT